MEPIIEVKNIGKRYNITHQQGKYIALRDVLTNIFKSPFKFLAKKTRQAVGLEKKEEFWALKNLNFTINKGDIVGIIGHNGAGKSTLLKILSQITPPTEGEIILRGKVGSLLEVGTGFHPELSGRENIFLNGAILGMSKKEIASKFDQIVEFSGVEKFLDTPVKYYSSGMYVRLAFSVAAHLEPDILIVDEVLAVGDAEFQKKCLGKMQEVTGQDGRTVIFVSHNIIAIEQLCKTTILLENGQISKIGPTKEITSFYTAIKKIDSTNPIFRDPAVNRGLMISSVKLSKENGEKATSFSANEKINLSLEIKNTLQIDPFHASWYITDSSGNEIAMGASVPMDTIFFGKNDNKISCLIDPYSMIPGRYFLRFILFRHEDKIYDEWSNVISFEITKNCHVQGTNFNYPGSWRATQYIKHKWLKK